MVLQTQQEGVPDCSKAGTGPCYPGEDRIVVSIGASGLARLIPYIVRGLVTAGKWIWRTVIVAGAKWLAGKYVEASRWAGDKLIRFINIFKKTPRLQGRTRGEMLRDAIHYTKSRGRTAEEKADLFDRLKDQISEKFPGWTAERSLGSDGSHIFMGGMVENMLIISPRGQIYTGSALPGVGVRYGPGNTVTPIYEALRQW